MQPSKARNGSSEVHKLSPITPRSSRVLKMTMSESDSASSKLTPTKSSTERSPKMIDHQSLKGPVKEKKRSIRSSELQSQITRFQEELKNTKEQLSSCELSKKRVQQEAEEDEKHLAAMSAKLEESQLQLLEFSIAEGNRLQEFQKVSQERDKAWQSELESLQKQHWNEIQSLKQQLDGMKSETAHPDDSEMTGSELETLKEDLKATFYTVENLRVQVRDRRMAEEEAKFIVSENQKQLEMANATIETLRADVGNLLATLNSKTSKLEESKVRVSALEEMVKEFQVVNTEVERRKPSFNIGCRASLSELEKLRAALEAAEVKNQEEEIRTTIQIQSAYETADRVKFNAVITESQLESTLEKTKVELIEAKSRLLVMEKEFQSTSEMNEELREEIKKGKANQFDSQLKLRQATTDVTELKTNILGKETALQSILEENEMLKAELSRKDSEHQKNYTAAIADAERARSAEQEALMRVGLVDGEVEESSKGTVKVVEQLEAAQAASVEMETELRRLKVQSDQWRKAAEAAAAILSPENNGRIVDRNSLFSHDLDDESPKKKNSNVLRKIGGLWKKSSK